MLAQHNIYEVEKGKSKYLLIKWKDETAPTGKQWKSLHVPVDKATKEEADRWFTNEYQPTTVISSVVPQKKSIRNLYETWIQLDKTIKRERLVEEKGHFKNWIFKHRIADIDLETEQDPEVCISFMDSIDLAPLSIRNVIKTLKNFIDDCRKYGLISFRTVNLMRDRIVATEAGPRTKIGGDQNTIVMTQEQVTTLLACDKVPIERRTRYYLGVSAGLRDSELSGLMWRDADLDTLRTITVDRQLKRGAGITFKAPKKKSFRTLPLHPVMTAMLKEWKASGWKERVGREPQADDPIFPNYQGEHYHPKSAKLFRDDLDKAGLSTDYLGIDGDSGLPAEYPFTFHALRRTFYSLLEAMGVEEQRRGALMGHKAQGVAAKHYLTRDLERCRQAIESLPLQKHECEQA